MKVHVNLNEVKGIEAVPEGIYSIRVDKVESKNSKSSGKPMIAIETSVTDGEFMGRMLFINLSLDEKALWKVKDFYTACGVGWADDGFETDDLIGAELKAQVETELYENKMTNRVTDFFKLS